MRRMGGVWQAIWKTYALMWVGSLALAGIGIPGIFGFAGFYSKDMMLEAAWGAHSGVGQYAFWIGIAVALLTAFYSWRLLFMTFHGKPKADEKTMAHLHESPAVMLLPLVGLALGAVFAGYLGYESFVGEGRENFWGDSLFVLSRNDSIAAAHHAPPWVGLAPLAVGLVGIAIAYLFYMAAPTLPRRVASSARGLYRFLLNKWYFDELYERLFVAPAKALGYGLWKTGDGALIDGVGPDGIAEKTLLLARRAGRLQTGYVYHYAFSMLIGVAALVTWYLFNSL
jgi:NADH-quinone oxidoreductase subunit L